MVVALSLFVAALFGTGDFLGGLAAKRATVVHVVAWSHVVGLAGVLLAALVMADSFGWRDLAVGAVAGACGGLGVGLLYRRLAIGPMHVVAPLTALTSAVVPTAWGVVAGERLSALAWVGIALGLVAIALVSSSAPASDEAVVTAATVVESLIAGAGFGGMFIFLDATDAATAPWPVVGARLLTTGVLGTVLLIGARSNRWTVTPPPGTFGLIAATGLADTGANVGILLATGQGDLTIVAVLSSLYPIATIVLARLVLSERMSQLQGVGFLGALTATSLIALG